MRIAFLAPAYPLRGGIAQFVAVLARKLEERGHIVKVFSFHRQYPRLLFPGKDQTEPGPDPLPIPSEPVLTPYNPLTWANAIRKISVWQPDELVFKYWIPFFAPAFGAVAKAVKKRTHCRVTAIIDNLEFHEKWVFADRFTRYALNPTDRLMVMSEAMLRSAQRKFPRKPVQRFEHPNYDFFTLTGRSREQAREKFALGASPTLLFFGYIKQYKGLRTLLEALPDIRQAIPNIKLLIGGEVYGDDREYTELIAKLHIGDNLRFERRYIANEEVGDFFRAADVAVLPYRSATQSGVTQAAFSFDLPVIATAVGGLTEVIHDGENGFLVPPENPHALATAVVRFFRENRGEAFREAIHRDMERFSWTPLMDYLTVEKHS